MTLPEGGKVTFDKKGFQDFLAVELRNLGLDGQGILESMEKFYAEREGESEAERKRTEQMNFRKMLFNDLPEDYKLVGADEEARRRHFNGRKTASLIPYFLMAEGRQDLAAQFARDAGKEDVAKALEASTFAPGGALIPEEYSSDFIGYLYNHTVVRRMGATVLDISGGNLILGRMNSPSTANWIGERQEIPESEQSFGQLKLNAKKLGVFVVMSNDLLRQAPAGFENMIRDDMSAVAVIQEDAAFIRGTGTEYTPKGIENWMATGQKFAGTGGATPTLAEITNDLLKTMYLVSKSNVPELRNGWIFHPRIKFWLMGIRDGNGNAVFQDMLSANQLYGAPIGTTKNIPGNLGGGSDETDVYYGDFSQLVIGDTLNTRIDMSTEASFAEAGGSRSAYQTDCSVARLIHETDMVMRHDTAFARFRTQGGAYLDA